MMRAHALHAPLSSCVRGKRTPAGGNTCTCTDSLISCSVDRSVGTKLLAQFAGKRLWTPLWSGTQGRGLIEDCAIVARLWLVCTLTHGSDRSCSQQSFVGDAVRLACVSPIPFITSMRACAPQDLAYPYGVLLQCSGADGIVVCSR